ncbi:hypothetical protein [Bradyrhizobium sp. 21]|uniref:hypothetical protein n=1 Tax=Bradyrhizobium sp. 21 TaxID=2782666 RepID=UPI001FFAB1C0|nr:hypothetical protein [Bradyrhizobium sp. 21]MCK1387056.1 hypothetical protein [Bradyrhizobium sp. 21]
MTEQNRLPCTLFEEAMPHKSLRPSHRKVMEQVERWANSTGLQPPKSQPPVPEKAG